MIQKKISFGRQVLGGPRSAETKHILVNPKAFIVPKLVFSPRFCNVAGVVYIAKHYLSLFVRLQHQPLPNIV
jgi:hypothetical protein